ncbi:hypothetical protein I5N59_00190 [Serratia marcescens]|uniref:hypothetical protein n=1 Tax=Serratia marcescens TaxID=615 RepID=UPI0018D8DF75|nr:hypothetical protein [Serratia marcescens]
MKERPVIFNGEMVRAILDGRKTQTRRVMKVQPESSGFGLRFITESLNNRDTGKYFWSQSDAVGINKPRSKPFPCPFGQVGDQMWVRETWAGAGASAPELQLYRANYPEHVGSEYENVPPASEIRWTPSIHMPRWASRITLEITAVRVERLQDISEADAIAEGGTKHFNIDWFGPLWASIYGVDSWNANPWVWVIEFRRVGDGAREVERG